MQARGHGQRSLSLPCRGGDRPPRGYKSTIGGKSDEQPADAQVGDGLKDGIPKGSCGNEPARRMDDQSNPLPSNGESESGRTREIPRQSFRKCPRRETKSLKLLDNLHVTWSRPIGNIKSSRDVTESFRCRPCGVRRSSYAHSAKSGKRCGPSASRRQHHGSRHATLHSYRKDDPLGWCCRPTCRNRPPVRRAAHQSRIGDLKTAPLVP